MAHYRVYKLNEKTGRIIKGKDLEAGCDHAAVSAAEQDRDCPVCEVWRGAQKVGQVVR